MAAVRTDTKIRGDIRNLQEKFRSAIYHGNLEEVKETINHGADLNKPNEFGSIPLSLAVLMGNLEIVNLLISLKADVNYVNKEGDSILHGCIKSAGKQHSLEITKVVLMHITDIDGINNEGNTPLHLAAMSVYPQENYISLLLDYGAKFNIKNKEGKTPLELASRLNSLHTRACVLEQNRIIKLLSNAPEFSANRFLRELSLTVESMYASRAANEFFKPNKEVYEVLRDFKKTYSITSDSSREEIIEAMNKATRICPEICHESSAKKLLQMTNQPVGSPCNIM